MFQNYLKIALRSFRKNSSQGLLNLTGLTFGLAICMLIAIFISNELSFDKYHQNASRIWRVNRIFYNQDGSQQLHLGHVSPPFAPLLKSDFPDIEQATRLLQNNLVVRREEARFVEDQVFFAEPNVFDIFDIPLTAGSPQTALSEPFSVLLNETTAKKYFGDENPVNQLLKADSRFDLKVTGVFKDFPYNSHWHPELLVSFATLNDTLIYGAEQLRTNWSNNSFSTFLRLPENYPTERLLAQFPAFLDRHMKSEYDEPSKMTKLELTPLTDIHLRSHLDSEIEANGDIKRVWIFSAIALFVLLIACINYMNLSTAYAAIRGKEIGIRQVSGARRSELTGQFLTESVLLALTATVLAGALVGITLPFVNKIFGQALQVSGVQVGWMLAAAVGLALLTGLAAGAYPAFFMASLKPIQVLKGGGANSPFRGSGGGGGWVRKALVVSQFTISTALIIATIVVFRQLNFMQDKSLGMSKEHVLTLNYYAQLSPKYESFRTEMLSNPAIKNMTRSSRIPSGRLLDNFGAAKVQLGAGDSLQQTTADLKFITVDHRFAATYGLGLAAGRFYEKDEGGDRFESFVVNEKAVEMLGWKSPEEAVGMRINYGGRDARLLGVLKDFNFESLHQDISAMIFFIPTDSTFFNALSIKVDGTKTQDAIAHMKAVWERTLPEYPFDYQFLDAQYGQLYEAEQRQGKIFIGFALLAILVACLGLFGLARFVAQQRVKEIGVRKVLGASTAGLVGLLSKDFLKLVVVALVIASPLAYFFMEKWLQDFAYRIDIKWTVFALAGIAAVGVAFLTVSFQSIKAALANPVKSLRSE